MKLSKKNSSTQAAIRERLRRGLPLAGLLGSMMAISGCDRFPPKTAGDTPDPHVVGKIAPMEQFEGEPQSFVLDETFPGDIAKPVPKGDAAGQSECSGDKGNADSRIIRTAGKPVND